MPKQTLFLTYCFISNLRQGLATHAVIMKNLLLAIVAELMYKTHC